MCQKRTGERDLKEVEKTPAKTSKKKKAPEQPPRDASGFVDLAKTTVRWGEGEGKSWTVQKPRLKKGPS